jgi:hypothetical protein
LGGVPPGNIDAARLTISALVGSNRFKCFYNLHGVIASIVVEKLVKAAIVDFAF